MVSPMPLNGCININISCTDLYKEQITFRTMFSVWGGGWGGLKFIQDIRIFKGTPYLLLIILVNFRFSHFNHIIELSMLYFYKLVTCAIFFFLLSLLSHPLVELLVANAVNFINYNVCAVLYITFQ